MAALFDDYTALETGGPGSSKDEKDAILASLLPPEYRALLRTISGSESNYGGGVDPYRVMYGGKQIQDFGDHPRVKIPIVSSSPNYGKYTTAAGGYQFLGSSWDEAKKALNLPDFSPESQDRAAIWHAENTYKAKTGRNLQDDIAKAQGKPAQLSDIGRALSGWWTSLPGGIEHNAATNSFGTRFAKELNSPDAYGGPALYGPDAPISNDIPTKARYASALGTDVPPVARNLRNSNMPSGMPAIMGGGGGENDMPSLLRGGISALQDPETMAYLQMIVKGLNPWSSLDPNKALANAQHLNLAREENALSRARDIRDYNFRVSQAGVAQSNVEEARKQHENEFKYRQEQDTITPIARHLMSLKMKPGTDVYNENYQKLIGLVKEDWKPITVKVNGEDTTYFQKDGVFKKPDELISGFGSSSVNPYATGGKFTNEQGKAANYADRMVNADKVIKTYENINQGISGAVGGAVSNVPWVRDSSAFNAASSSERQQVNQAQRSFLNAILRRESGAAISPSEFENGRLQYFPQPGDSPDVLKQKADNRRSSIEGLMRESGPHYKPPKDWNSSASSDGWQDVDGIKIRKKAQ